MNGFSKSEYSDLLFTAYHKRDMELWKNVIDNMQANELNQNNMEFTSELLSFQYGYVAWKLGNKFEDQAEKHLDIAEENLEWLEE